jgi:exodeoxyribonuclease III
MPTVKELQALLRARGLPVSGRKAVLIERLARADALPIPAPPAATNPTRTTLGAKAVIPQSIRMDATPRRRALLGDPSTLNVASWNVAGLRGLLKREAGVESLRSLVQDERVDVLLLQETKLQEVHVPAVEEALLDVLGGATDGQWRAAWACSTARKGYSGVSTLWNDRALGEVATAASCKPLTIDSQHEAEREGRTLMLDLPLSATHSLRIGNVYTPNSGAELNRLDYRTGPGGWDDKFRTAIGQLGSHVCVGGDFNVAVEDADFFNPGEPRMAKQAGTTPMERKSFRAYTKPPLQLVDGFRQAHPDAHGQFTYWSQRARNRPRNRGLRLDYFLLTSGLASALIDVQHLQLLTGSDHCPVLMQLDLARLAEQ